MRLIKVFLWEVASVISVPAGCVVMTVIASVKMNVTSVVLFFCVVKESGFDSKVG